MGVRHGTPMQFGAEAVLKPEPVLAALLGVLSIVWALLELHLAFDLRFLISATFEPNKQRALDPS
jgi:hypothetical protein